jgi:hypothetical protein
VPYCNPFWGEFGVKNLKVGAYEKLWEIRRFLEVNKAGEKIKKLGEF